MNRAEELENVKTACALEYMIARLEEEAVKLNRDKPQKPSEPTKPLKMTLQAQPIPYPEIVPPPVVLPSFWKRGVIILGVSFFVMVLSMMLGFISPIIMFIFMTLSVFGIMAGIFCLLIDAANSSTQKRRITEQRIEEIRNSSEYQAQCRQIDEQNRMRQEQLDKEVHDKYIQSCVEYNAAHREYTVALKDYEEKQLVEWSANVTELNNMILDTKNALQQVYNRNVIPIQYRNKSALTYLMMFLGTSNYDLKTAIERYDADVNNTMQRENLEVSRARLCIERGILQNTQYANLLNEQMGTLLEEGGFSQGADNSSRGHSGGLLRAATYGLREKYRTVDLLGSAHCAKAR
ncbi:MAG: hypothetical protein NC452_20915, partial [Eubacterium sp.]|nr:hypothetical protein [Eubacterium sp.]